MSKGEARHNQSAMSFNVEKKACDKIIPRSNKTERKVVKDTSPTPLVNQASTSTIREKSIRVYTNYLSPQANKSNPNID